MAWPVSENPKTEFTALRMPVDEHAAMEQARERVGENKSEFIRRAVAARVAKIEKKAGGKTDG